MSNAQELAEKIARALEDADEAEPYIFKKDEVRELQRVILFVRRLDGLKYFSKYALWVVVTAGAVIGNWERIRTWFGGG